MVMICCQQKIQGPSIVGPPFPYYSHTIPIRIPWSMGMIWEAYGKGVPLLRVPGKIPNVVHVSKIIDLDSDLSKPPRNKMVCTLKPTKLRVTQYPIQFPQMDEIISVYRWVYHIPTPPDYPRIQIVCRRLWFQLQHWGCEAVAGASHFFRAPSHQFLLCLWPFVS